MADEPRPVWCQICHHWKDGDDCQQIEALQRELGNLRAVLLDIDRRVEASEAWGGATPNEHALADVATLVGAVTDPIKSALDEASARVRGEST